MMVDELPVDSQPKAVDRRMPSKTPGFWTVWICRQEHTEPENLSSVCCLLSTAPSWLSTGDTIGDDL
ncbi:hypothetical protein Taro_030211 [Colocasia esculenta]|uniref:Uncharacterized protein n=1 Tax=Colocasia esculenta TaxID=4460 RepID=A0A843VKW5_COLES|nr:hypothetical protein [Colocasia esculenta]